MDCDADREQLLDTLAAHYLEGMGRGQPPDRQTLLERHPDLAAELSEFFADQDTLYELTTPLRFVARASRLCYAETLAGGAPRAFGAYELLAEIGRGGMGVVYRARQKQPQRLVALKLLRPDVSATDLQRFRTEAEAAASLDHPNMVPIYEVGEVAGQPYFSMKLIEGESLAEELREQRPRDTQEKQRNAAQLVATVARAVHHAHQRGVLHRDLKPANIVVDSTGRPYVTDFGLAKRLDIARELTHTDAIIGTPGYMAPEQTQGRKGSVTIAADVYGLGAILYALLSGKAPFAGDTVLETLEQVRYSEPEPLRSGHSLVDGDLQTICLKCLEKEPARRYDSAETLANDLERWLAGEPIQARPVGRWGRTRRWCRRNPLLAGLTGLIAALFVVGFTGLVVGLVTVSRSWQALDQQRALLRQRVYPTDMKQAHQFWQDGQLSKLAETLASYAPRPGEEDLRGFEWHFLNERLRRTHCEPKLTLRGHTGILFSVAYSPDGKTIASGGIDASIILWDAASGEKQAVLTGHTDDVNWLSFSPDGRVLASASDDKSIRLWNLANKREEAILSCPDKVECAVFSRDGKNLASGGWDRTVRIWDVARRVVETEWSSPELEVIEVVAFAPDGRNLATADHSGRAIIWDRAGQKLHCMIAGRRCLSVAFSPDGTQLASGADPGQVCVWRTGSDRLLRACHEEAARGVQFSSDGKLLASCGHDGLVRVWSVENYTLQGQFQAHVGQAFAAAFSPLGGGVATAGEDGLVKVWRLADVVPLAGATARFTTPLVTAMCFSPDLRTLAALGKDGGAEVWKTATGQHIASGRSTAPWWLNFSADSRCLALYAGDGKFVLQDVATGALLENVEKPPTYSGLTGVTTPHGDTVISCDWAEATATERLTGRVLARLAGQFRREFTPKSLTLSPDGAIAALGNQHGDTMLWNWGTGEVRTMQPGHRTAVQRIAFSADGLRLAAISGDGMIKVWTLATRVEHATLAGHTEQGALSFSADGKTLASGSEDGSVRLWHVATGQELFALEGHRGPVFAVQFSPDGQTLATAGLREPDVEWYWWTTGPEVEPWKRDVAGARDLDARAK